jgi:methyl-accepting chemotaxis protein
LVGAGFLIRSIKRPLLEANELAARISQGDLCADIDNSRADEFGDLMRSLAVMNGSLGRMVSQVRASTDNIAIASEEIARGNTDLANRTEQTSSNLQATASSMENLTNTVHLSATNARQASSLATNASDVAQRGGSVVGQVIETMHEINTSSKKISDIIGVIDSIAFQTNILALNAAVEAARAGEQGRGFAVVASEVRNLAGRSADAAREIKKLIVSSVEKVESGTRLVTDAGSTMDEILVSVRRVADVVSEITAAASEQSAGIAGVNQSIGDLDQMTQQNAALVEQSAAAAESLSDQANRMKQAVAVFKLPQRQAAWALDHTQ